jgi:LysR family glycine cleavage system transcriptional activator/LysR family transcriptional regulator of beta-lactamase
VARLGTFAEAARELNVTRPAISKQIKGLEEHMGCQLLVRSKPRVVLTDEGMQLAAGLRQAFDLISATTQRVVENAHRPEAVRILVERDFASSWLAERIGGFLIEHPGISVEINAERNGRLRMGEDFSFRIFYGPEERFATDDLAEDFLCDWIDLPLCTPEYAAEHIVDGHLSRTAHFLLDKNYDPWEAWFEKSGVANLVSQAVSTSFNETTLCLSAALAGSGITIGDSFLCLSAIQEGRLVAPFKLGLRSIERYAICHTKERSLSTAEAEFRDWLGRAIESYQGRVEEVISEIGIEVIDT